MTRRFNIDWTFISEKELEGIVYLWEYTGDFHSQLAMNGSFFISLKPGIFTMQGINGGTLPIISEEENTKIKLAVDSFFAGVNRKQSIYIWSF